MIIQHKNSIFVEEQISEFPHHCELGNISGYLVPYEHKILFFYAVYNAVEYTDVTHLYIIINV